MQAIKAGLITTGGFLLLGLLTAFTLNSCSSTVSHLINQAFNIPQKIVLKKGVYHVQVPIKNKGYFLEMASDDFTQLCNNPDDPSLFNRAEGGEQCINDTCRFFFNNDIPESIEYLTKDNEGECAQINQLVVDPDKTRKIYEVSILIPKAVSTLSKGSLTIEKKAESKFNTFSQLSIGHRSRVDLEYTSPVTEDQLLINNILFKINVTYTASKDSSKTSK